MPAAREPASSARLEAVEPMASAPAAVVEPAASAEPMASASAAVAEPVASTSAVAPEPAASAEPPSPRKASRHHLDVPAAHVEAGTRRDYTVYGDGHSHPITIDEGAMAQLASAGYVLVKCGLGGPDKPHRHWVVVHVG